MDYEKEYHPAPLFTDDITFLSVEDVIAIHENQIRTYSPGESLAIRDRGLLESAVMAVQQTFDGEYLYGSITEMAAVYLSGIAKNHAFENGNKRAAFAASSVFLRMNGFRLALTQDEAVELVLGVIAHRIDREQLSDLIGKSIQPNS